jgi:anti-sigma B factor antagonist
MSVGITERQVGPVTILELSGRLALGEGSTALNEKLQSLIGEGRVNMLLECSRVTALDSQGISALVRGIISTQKRGGKLKLLRVAPRVRHVLEVTRLLSVIESFEDEAKALASY